jgi:hypothetical protein
MAARLLMECDAMRPALAVYRAILRNAPLGREWRANVLREGIKAAHAADDQDQAGTWEKELEGKTAP